MSDGVVRVFRGIDRMVFEDSDANLQELMHRLRRASEGKQDAGLYASPPAGRREVREDVFQALLEAMPDQVTAGPSTCANDTGRLIVGLQEKQPWAVPFFDATGKPGPSLTQLRLKFVGNYDQCRAASVPPQPGPLGGPGFNGRYFVVNVRLYGVPLAIEIGVCLPDTCTDAEITALMYQLLAKQIKEKQISGVLAYALTGETHMTAATIASILILSIIGFMMVIGTLYDIIAVQVPKWTEEKRRFAMNTNTTGLHDGDRPAEDLSKNAAGNRIEEKSPLLPVRKENAKPNLVAEVFMSFSVYSNGKKILNTSQPPGSLGAIHGIRFLSMSWVVMCHTFANSQSNSLNSFTETPEMIKRWTFMPIINGFVSVDTFFTLSGLLTSYLTLKEITRRNTWKINWPLFYFHRFWRLTPPYMLTLLIVLGLSQFLGQGPLWSPVQPIDKSFCENNWWTNLLYINNVVRSQEACFGHSWYLANDMQFFVLSPLMLIPFFFHPAIGLLSCSVFLLTSWITTGVLSTTNNWPTTAATLAPAADRAGNEAWMKDYYYTPWCRIGPFIVGVVAGYILSTTKGRQFRMPMWVVALGWIVATVAGLAVVYGIRGDIIGDNPSTIGAAALYNAVNRSVWGACVSWVIIACSAGYGGPVNALLSWSPFVVLGRLTYMAYLIHICILIAYFQNMDALFITNDTNLVICFLGLLLFVNMAAFVSALALESPMLGLEKAFIKRDRK